LSKAFPVHHGRRLLIGPALCDPHPAGRGHFVGQQRISLVSGAVVGPYQRMPKVEPLSRDEFAALKAIAIGPPSQAVHGKLQERLVQLGYVKDVLGNLVITDEGTKLITLSE
jgi:hypothetical protein